MHRSVVVHISCSAGIVCPPMSVSRRSYLVSWLQKWLQIEDLTEIGGALRAPGSLAVALHAGPRAPPDGAAIGHVSWRRGETCARRVPQRWCGDGVSWSHSAP